VPDQQHVIGSELDEFADFVRGLQASDDGSDVAERMDRWFEPRGRVAAA
jgi:hypothetical protein